MRADLEKMARVLDLVDTNPRLSVRRLRAEAGLSRAAAYRYIQALSFIRPIRLEAGVIINQKRSL